MGLHHTYRYIQTDISEIPPADLGNTLEESSWQAIAYHASIGDLSDYFSIGDTKTFTFLDGISYVTSYRVTMEIADFNHDNYVGTVDFICKYTYFSSGIKFANESNNLYGFSSSFIRTKLNYYIYFAIPSECRKYIIDKLVGTNGGVTYPSIYFTINKIWIPTAIEVFGPISDSDYYIENYRINQSQYPIFTNKNNRIKKDSNSGGSAIQWWTATPNKKLSSGKTYVCTTTGDMSTLSYSQSANVAFGFRLGKKSDISYIQT